MFVMRCSDESSFEQTVRPGKGTLQNDQPTQRHCRKALLQEIRVKWGKFSEQELTELKSNDDLVTQLVAKYGLSKEAAQRDADSMRKGRDI